MKNETLHLIIMAILIFGSGYFVGYSGLLCFFGGMFIMLLMLFDNNRYLKMLTDYFSKRDDIDAIRELIGGKDEKDKDDKEI